MKRREKAGADRVMKELGGEDAGREACVPDGVLGSGALIQPPAGDLGVQQCSLPWEFWTLLQDMSLAPAEP